MIVCPVCQTHNHHLAVVCSSCRSFIQTRIENLDLFTTTWGIIEHPRKTFLTIALAKHKNYSFLLSAISGIGFIFTIFWIIKAGNYTESLMNILSAGLCIGPLFGITVVLMFSIIMKLIGRLFSVRITFRNLFAMNAYALVPVVISVGLVLPVELLSFGRFFFSTNPSPLLLKPVSYIILLCLDGMLSIWTIVLQLVGYKVLDDVQWLKIILINLLSFCVCIGIIAWVLTTFVHPA